MIPLGIRFAILIRLILFSFHVYDTGLDYLLASGRPSPGGFSSFINPAGTPAGTNIPTGPGGGGSPPPRPSYFSVVLNPTEAESSALIESVKTKVDLQRAEVRSSKFFSIYSPDKHSAEATLTRAEADELGRRVQQDERIKQNGIYNAVYKKSVVDNTPHLKVVVNRPRRDTGTYINEAQCSEEFRNYIKKFH